MSDKKIISSTNLSKAVQLAKFFIISTSISILPQFANTQDSSKSASNQSQFVEPPSDQKLYKNMKQITFEGPRSGEGYFSRDGKTMVFQSERSEGNPFYQIYLMNLETGKTSRVSPGVGKTTCAWIHPSLKKIIFSSTHLDPQLSQKVEEEISSRKTPQKKGYSWSYDENFDIFESDWNGKKLKQLTHEKGYDAEGDYSPDGKKIVFASNRLGYTEKLNEEETKLFAQDPSYMMDLYLMDADGKNVERLTTARGYDGGPFFSSDGQYITWRRFAPNGQNAEIYTMNLKSKEEKEVTHLKAMSWAPFFHPSGDYIVFTSNLLGYQNFELFIVDTAGTQKPIRVTQLEGFDGLPVFTPDGQKISWTRRDNKGESQIFMADWDDALARRLLHLAPRISFEGLTSSSVRESDLKSWIQYLTSEAFAGRPSGSEEEKIYMNRISDYFKTLGMKPVIGNSFLVPFSFTSDVKVGDRNKAVLNDSKKSTDLILEKEFLPMSFSANGSVPASEITFAGYGIKAPASDKSPAYNSFKDLNVKGKWAMVLQDVPDDMSTEAKIHLLNYSRLQHKAFIAKNEGAIGLLVIARTKDFHPKVRFEGANSETAIPVLQISQKLANTLLSTTPKSLEEWKKDLDKTPTADSVLGFEIKEAQIAAEVELIPIKSEGLNVLGQFPSAKGLTKNKNGFQNVIALGAHADHLGRGQMGSSLASGEAKGNIHYGADDNASGVAGLLEVAGQFSKVPKNSLKNSVVFGVWSGEEIGLLGSHAFLQSYLKQTKNSPMKAYINLDMIGRLKDQVQLMGVGSAKEWKNIIESLAPKTDLNFSLQEDPYVPSDGMAFYLQGTPMIMLFTGSHGEYHTPADTIEKINFKGLQQVSEFTGILLKELSQKDPLLTLKKVESSQRKLEGRSFRVYLGSIPDYSQEGVKGVRISGTTKNSPAEKAGLLAGDIIIELSGTQIQNLYDYAYSLQAIKAGSETSIKVMRQEKVFELKILPQLKD